MSIYVIDEIMGRGKTSAMINFINAAPEDKKFLFITPYLTEVKRIRDGCAATRFFEPIQEGGKLKNIKELLKDGKNIVSTHALFSMLDTEALDAVRRNGYTLIMDEVATVFQKVLVTKWDAATIMRQYATRHADGLLEWRAAEYDGKFADYKQLIDNKLIYAYTDSAWVTMMPTTLFTSFEDVYVMTYMFSGQMMRCYFDMHKIQYEYRFINGHDQSTYTIGKQYEPGRVVDYRSLIHIENDRRMNNIGNDYNSMSKSWYMKHDTPKSLDKLKSYVYTFFRHHVDVKSSETLWTTFTGDDEANLQWRKILAGNGYSKGYLVCNARGTNTYRDRTALAYLVNRFPDPMQYNFLISQGIEYDRDAFALSEMLQWIWRSAIRDGKEITIYIPSKRMRTLLENWIEDVSRKESEIEQRNLESE